MSDDVEPPAGALAIVGAGGHGREVLDIVDGAGLRDRFVGFVDDSTPDAEALARLHRRGADIVGDVAWLMSSGLDHVIAIGLSAARRRIAGLLDSETYTGRALTLTHPTASIGSDVRLDPGVIVGARTVVTTNVSIGRHTHLNVGCAVQHDSVLGEFVTMSPGVFVNGDVTIGDDVFIGTGAVVTRGCRVGDGAVIGAGAVVLDDVAAGARVFGVPARPGRPAPVAVP